MCAVPFLLLPVRTTVTPREFTKEPTVGHVVDGPQFLRAFSKQCRLVDCARLVPLVLVISDGPLSGHTHPLQPEKRVHLPV